MNQPESFGAGGCLEQGLLSRHVQTHHRPDEKGEDQRIGCLGRELVDVDPTFRVRQLQSAGRQLEEARWSASTSVPRLPAVAEGGISP